MILYTTMPYELVYPCENDAFGKQKLITYQGIEMLVESTDDQNYQIVRIMSTDPQHYMNAACCPGTKISFANAEC